MWQVLTDGERASAYYVPSLLLSLLHPQTCKISRAFTGEASRAQES